MGSGVVREGSGVVARGLRGGDMWAQGWWHVGSGVVRLDSSCSAPAVEHRLSSYGTWA